MDKEQKKVKSKHNKKKIIIRLLICILIGVFLYTSISIILDQVDVYNNKKENEKLVDNFVDQSDENENLLQIDFDKLIQENEDIKGWIKFNGEYINYPFVQGKDNTYYLNRGFNKKNNSRGSIFMDFRNKSLDDDNLILFGHASRDNSMFGSLRKVFEKGFFDQPDSDIIYIYDLNNEVHKYQIFSYYTIVAEDYYITPSFKTKKEFEKFIKTVKERSFGNRNVEVNTDDKLLTLSTCAGPSGSNNRRVIHAKKIS